MKIGQMFFPRYNFITFKIIYIVKRALINPKEHFVLPLQCFLKY